MISDICKRRCCYYLSYTPNGCYCRKRNHGLDYEDDEDLGCDDECDDYDNDNDD